MASPKRERVKPRPRPFRFYVGKGNNPDLIREVLGSREWWEEITQEEIDQGVPYNFKWKQLNYRKAELESLGTTRGVRQCCNHFENNMEICSKSGLFRNITYYYERVLQKDCFGVIPVTFNFTSLRDPEYGLFQDTFNACEEIKAKLADGVPLEAIQPAGSSVNNDSNSGSNANARSPNGKSPAKSAKSEDKSDEKRASNAYNFKFSNRVIEPRNSTKNVWILKPGYGTNRAIGIKVFTRISELEEHIEKWTSKKNPVYNWIVQKYMERPLLIHGRKFDIRAYSMVTHNLDLYFYNEGYLRTSSETYDLESEDRNVHLTNWAVQKKAESYGEHEDANQMDYKQFQEYLDEHHPESNISVEDHLKERMKELVTHTFLAAMGSFNLNNYKYCIELFGYDFMVDDQFRVFLIEVNNNPCICTPGDVLEDMLPRLLEDVMKIGLDPLFPASGDCLNKGRPKVSVTNFVLLHSSSCKATMEMREKQRQDAREARRQEMKAASSPHPNASSPHKPKVPLLKPNNVSTRSSQMLAVDEQLTSPVEPQAEEIIPPHEEDDEVYSDEEKQSDSSAVMDAEDTSNTSRSGGESEMGQDAYIEHTPAGTETIELVCSDKKSPQPSPQLQQQSLPHSQQQIPPAVEQTRSPQVLLHRRVTGAPAERWSELWKTDPSPTFHADKEAVKNAMSQTFNGRLRQKEAWSSRMASQKSSGAQLSRMDLSAGCAFLDSTGSNVVSDLTVSPLRHQVELQSLQHRHFKGKSVGAARRSRHEASQATAGLSQSQLRSPTHPVRSHLPGIGSPPGSQRLSPNTNESMSTPQRMVREAACEAEDVARQLRDAGMINEAAQLERLRVELLQPGADLTAKKNEARSLAERLRTQARERQAGSLRSTDLLMQRNNASKTRRDMFQLHMDTKSEGNRRAASGAQLPAVMGTCALSPTVVNIG